jgi:hypothetical protein
VPAERARPHVPAGLPLDTRPDENGEPLAFVQSTCFFNDNLHWSPLGRNTSSGQSYHQSTYRILTRRNDRRGAYFVRTCVGTSESYAAQRAIAGNVEYAPFSVHIAGDPVARRYERYTVRAASEHGQTNLDVRGLPPGAPRLAPSAPASLAENEEDAIFFLTQREEGCYPAAVGGVGLMPVEHPPLRPVGGELVGARLWTDLGLLEKDDLLRPVAVLIEPSVVFTVFPPRPVLSLSRPVSTAVTAKNVEETKQNNDKSPPENASEDDRNDVPDQP